MEDQKYVLLAEKDGGLRESYIKSLEDKGYHVMIACDANGLLVMLRSIHADIIVSDIEGIDRSELEQHVLKQENACIIDLSDSWNGLAFHLKNKGKIKDLGKEVSDVYEKFCGLAGTKATALLLEKDCYRGKIRKSLEKEGFNVTYRGDVEDALDLCKKVMFDTILIGNTVEDSCEFYTKLLEGANGSNRKQYEDILVVQLTPEKRKLDNIGRYVRYMYLVHKGNETKKYQK